MHKFDRASKLKTDKVKQEAILINQVDIKGLWVTHMVAMIAMAIGMASFYHFGSVFYWNDQIPLSVRDAVLNLQAILLAGNMAFGAFTRGFVFGAQKYEHAARAKGKNPLITAKKVVHTHFILSVLTLSLAIFPSIYASNLSNAVFVFLSTHIPQLGERLSQLTARAVVYMTTGVTGLITTIVINVLSNYIYDKLKRKPKGE